MQIQMHAQIKIQIPQQTISNQITQVIRDKVFDLEKTVLILFK